MRHVTRLNQNVRRMHRSIHPLLADAPSSDRSCRTGVARWTIDSPKEPLGSAAVRLATRERRTTEPAARNVRDIFPHCEGGIAMKEYFSW